MTTQYGKTWWGQEWLKSLAHIDYDNRLPRGRAYANKGAVLMLATSGNVTYSRVQGSRRTPYRVTLGVPEFTHLQKENFLDELVKDPYLVSMLLKRDLPSSIINVINRLKLPLFPTTWRDLEMECSCPDWAVPCKHIAAVIYTMSLEIDRNPFTLFELHGLDIPKALESRQIVLPATARDTVPLINNLLLDAPPDTRLNPIGDPSEEIDFTRMEDLLESLKALLNPAPLFSKADFKPVIVKAWKDLGLAVKHSIEEATVIEDAGFSDPYLLVKSVQLVVDEKMFVQFLLTRSYPGQSITKVIPFKDIFPVISRISDRHLDLICPDLSFLRKIYQFCLSLALHHAVVPKIYQSGNEQFIVRWEPALLNEQVRDIFSKLLSPMRPDFVRFEIPGKKGKKPMIRFLSGEDSLNLVCSWFLNRFIDEYLYQPGLALQNPADEKLVSLFFGSVPVAFNGLNEKEIPGSIYIWLNKFHIISGLYR